MIRQGWLYPGDAATTVAGGEEPLIEGLLLARREIERVPGETIEYHDVVRDESVATMSVFACRLSAPVDAERSSYSRNRKRHQNGRQHYHPPHSRSPSPPAVAAHTSRSPSRIGMSMYIYCRKYRAFELESHGSSKGHGAVLRSWPRIWPVSFF